MNPLSWGIFSLAISARLDDEMQAYDLTQTGSIFAFYKRKVLLVMLGLLDNVNPYNCAIIFT
jgi:hypothetical protein